MEIDNKQPLSFQIFDAECEIEFGSLTGAELETVRRIQTNLYARRDTIEWLQNLNPLCFLTITFCINQIEEDCEKQVNVLMRMIRNEYMKKSDPEFIKGVVIREYQQNETVHYHILISDHPVFHTAKNQKKDFLEIVEEKCFRITEEIWRKGKWEKIRPINPFTGFDARLYFYRNLEEYLTKTMKWSPKNTDFIAPMIRGEFEFANWSKARPCVRRNLEDDRFNELLKNHPHIKSGKQFKAYQRKRKRVERFKANSEARKDQQISERQVDEQPQTVNL